MDTHFARSTVPKMGYIPRSWKWRSVERGKIRWTHVFERSFGIFIYGALFGLCGKDVLCNLWEIADVSPFVGETHLLNRTIQNRAVLEMRQRSKIVTRVAEIEGVDGLKTVHPFLNFEGNFATYTF